MNGTAKKWALAAALAISASMASANAETPVYKKPPPPPPHVVSHAVPGGSYHPNYAFHGTYPHGYSPYDFHGRDFRTFGPHDLAVWRAGSWQHAWHDGRYGWWWAAGGVWYFYPVPMYPYPTYVPPAVVVPAPIAVGPAPPRFWYHCGSPAGYYPYVASCPGGWSRVPAP